MEAGAGNANLKLKVQTRTSLGCRPFRTTADRITADLDGYGGACGEPVNDL
jgi:hypothetical protein